MNADSDLQQVVDLVQRSTEENDSISVYGNWDIVYVLSKRKHATHYSYQFPISDIMPQIKEEYWMQLENELPVLIVIQPGFFDDDISSFLNSNDYELLWIQENENMESAMIYSYKGVCER